MAASIVQLSQLISDSVAKLIDGCTIHNVAIPSLTEPYNPESDAFRAYAECAEAATIIAAAALQLVATIAPPKQSVADLLSGVSRSYIDEPKCR